MYGFEFSLKGVEPLLLLSGPLRTCDRASVEGISGKSKFTAVKLFGGKRSVGSVNRGGGHYK